MITFSRRFLAAGSLFFASFMGLLIAAEVEQARAEYPAPFAGEGLQYVEGCSGPGCGSGEN